jgi:hypothetical protein
LEFKWK